MSDQADYLWLEQQGEAFGAPGLEPRWTSSVKDAVGTAYSASSRVWFTCSHGILNEIYHPTIDRAQVRDMEFLVTDGETFVHEEKRDLDRSFEYIDTEALGVRYVNRDPEGRYTPDQGDHLRSASGGGADACAPGRARGPVAAAEGVCAAGSAPGWRRSRQHGAGAGCGRTQDAAGVEGLVGAGHGRQLRLFAGELRVCGHERRLARPEGQLPHGLGVWLGHRRQYRGDGRTESLQRRSRTARASLRWPSASEKASTRRCRGR